MDITVEIPTVLRPRCGGSAELQLQACSAQAALNAIEEKYPELYQSVCDETGVLRRHVNIFINSTLIRSREELDADLQKGDVIGIFQAVSGG